MLKFLKIILPIVILLLVLLMLWRALGMNPTLVPSPLVNKALPELALPNLFNPQQIIHSQDFTGRVILLNVWASWCNICRMEHDTLMQINRTYPGMLVGLNYKDDPAKAQQWLKVLGNPYALNLEDSAGQAAINLGVYGTPETYLIDRHGIIRYKQIGAITPEIWYETLAPMIAHLQEEP